MGALLLRALRMLILRALRTQKIATMLMLHLAVSRLRTLRGGNFAAAHAVLCVQLRNAHVCLQTA